MIWDTISEIVKRLTSLPPADPGATAVAEARRLFDLDVYDPPRGDQRPAAQRSRLAIDALLKASGWTWEVPYRGDGQVEWCGLFAGACWRTAGMPLDTVRTFLPSTYRLDLWGRYKSFDAKHVNARPLAGPRRLFAEFDEHSTLLPFEPRAGDILTIGPAGSGYGKHICLVESYESGVFHTIEGNGVGVGPDGNRRQGIVRGRRSLGGTAWHARRLIRPAPGDVG